MSPSIRRERPEDALGVAAVVQEAFRERPVAGGRAPAIVASLRNKGGLYLSLVSEREGKIVGHIAFSRVFPDDGSLGWFGLGPVAVHPDHRGQGIGGELVSAGLALLREQGAAGCLVVGEPAFYERFGFDLSPALVLDDAAHTPFHCIRWRGPRPFGVVHYDEAFDQAC